MKIYLVVINDQFIFSIENAFTDRAKAIEKAKNIKYNIVYVYEIEIDGNQIAKRVYYET